MHGGPKLRQIYCICLDFVGIQLALSGFELSRWDLYSVVGTSNSVGSRNIAPLGFHRYAYLILDLLYLLQIFVHGLGTVIYTVSDCALREVRICRRWHLWHAESLSVTTSLITNLTFLISSSNMWPFCPTRCSLSISPIAVAKPCWQYSQSYSHVLLLNNCLSSGPPESIK
jgi:hypothetical protein